ncbi:tyrosine-type recombinase/integrase [Bacillus weihaiensis]|uniref:DNA integration/recombination/inversion protein n=1 Tax=Bacillus weihaiensis TaxID=1547283 RepID=A0A1L3MVV2_9BACI|nr:tyrosine-type recombinase/integrase [Bacillus weihaiensis]APH06463.1 DNA integration/recombination/inversion protein [Bacillus weihaiensis]
MKHVDGIKDFSQLLKMKEYLKTRSPRDYCLFLLGINTGIRIYDLLHLHVGDFVDEKQEVQAFMKSSIHLNPPVYLNQNVREAIEECISYLQLQPSDYLFKSKKTCAPITRQQAYRILNEAAKQAGITEAVGTHTLRKTFGYHAYKSGIAVSLIQKRLQQSTPSETKHYIGLQPGQPIDIKLDVHL